MAESVPCVYCRAHPADHRFRPFCSDRCRLLDLGAWLDGRYRVEPPESSEPDEDLESSSLEEGDD